MGLFKRAFVRGAVHELTAQGLVKWANEEMQELASDEIADGLGEGVPEQLPEEGMDPEQAQEIMDTIVTVAEELAGKTAAAADLGINKAAADSSYEDAAAKAALKVMEKAAEETAVASGPDIPGPSTPPIVEGPTAETQADRVSTPSSAIVGPQGSTSLDTKPGAIGKEMPQSEQPGAVDTPPTGEVSKLSSLLSLLGVTPTEKTAAASGASLSGGTVSGGKPTPRKDIDDNLNIPGVVAKAQGQTAQNIPASAMIGALAPQPAGNPGPTAATPNDPSSDAVKKAAADMMKSLSGRAALQKIAEVYNELSVQYQQDPSQVAAQVLGNMSNILSQ